MQVTQAAWVYDPRTGERVSIRAAFGSDELFVPIAPGNRHYDAVMAAEAGGLVIADDPPPPFVEPARFVPKLTIVDRLIAAGKLEDALALLGSNVAMKARWDAATAIASDDPHMRAALGAIGADPDAILG